MPSEMRELPGELTALDWGAAGLLHLLNIKVVERHISEWINALERCGKEANPTAPEDAFIFNLVSGLNEAQAIVSFKNGLNIKTPIRCDSSDLKDETERGRIIGDIVAELKRANGSPRALFNSYYYVAFDKYGEKGEYYFVPLSIPLLGTGASEEIAQQFRDYLRKGDVPLRVDPARVDQYRTTILPARGGVTPQLCRLALRSMDKRSKEETDPEPIDWFLADLAIIGKTEDHVNRHRSAIIAPIIERRGGNPRCQGAVVLTCSIPGGFSPPKEDEQRQGARSVLQKEFSRIIDIWATAPLSGLHRNLKRESKGPRARVFWDALLDVGLSTGPLEDQLRLELVKKGAEGVVAVGGYVDSPAKDVHFAVINADALGHSVRTVMCPGPMLVPRVLCETFEEPIVDPQKARRHFHLMDRFTDPTSSEKEACAAASSILTECLPGFRALYIRPGDPTDGAHSVPNSFRIVRSGTAALRLVALVQGEGETCAVRSLLEDLHKCCLEAMGSERPLPDETSPFFSLLQQCWTEQHDLGLSVGTEDSKLKEPYALFDSVLNQSSVHSVFVFLGTK